LAEGHVPAFIDCVIQRKSLAKMGVQTFLVANCSTASKCHWVQRRRGILCHEVERAASHASVHGLERNAIVRRLQRCIPKSFRGEIGPKDQELAMVISTQARNTQNRV
jgi:hypothetical protein